MDLSTAIVYEMLIEFLNDCQYRLVLVECRSFTIKNLEFELLGVGGNILQTTVVAI